jgi:hypothetical protein
MICREADEEESNGHIRGRELENDNIIIDNNYSSDHDIPLELPLIIYSTISLGPAILVLFYVEYILYHLIKVQKYIIKKTSLFFSSLFPSMKFSPNIYHTIIEAKGCHGKYN